MENWVVPTTTSRWNAFILKNTFWGFKTFLMMRIISEKYFLCHSMWKLSYFYYFWFEIITKQIWKKKHKWNVLKVYVCIKKFIKYKISVRKEWTKNLRVILKIYENILEGKFWFQLNILVKLLCKLHLKYHISNISIWVWNSHAKTRSISDYYLIKNIATKQFSLRQSLWNRSK